MKTYRYTGRHADFLKSGRPVAPGEIVRVKKEDEDDRLITEGLMMDIRSSETSTDEQEES